MDELTAIRLFRDGLGPREVDPPPAVTEQVLAEIRADVRPAAGARRRAPSTVRVRTGAGRPAAVLRGIRRRPLLLVPVVAAACVLALVVTGPGSDGGGTSRPPGPLLAVPAASDEIAAEPATNLDARTILLAAAHRAGTDAAQVPAAGSYIYIRQTGISYYEQPQGTARYAGGMNEFWVSADGTRTGLHFAYGQVAMSDDTPDSRIPDELETLGACPGPPITDADQGFPSNYCTGPGYLADIPETAAGALAYLRRPRPWFGWTPFLDRQPASAQRRASDLEVFENANQLALQHLVAPRSMAAIYQALAGLRGVQVIPDARTATGRVGVSVAMVDPEARTRFELIFDPSGYQLIGNRTVALDVVAGVRNRVVGSSSIVITAVVQQAGLRPDGSRVRG